MLFSMFSIHPVGKPLYEVDDMHGYEILRELIEEKFPFLTGDEIGNIFKNVIQCVNFQEHVRRLPFVRCEADMQTKILLEIAAFKILRKTCSRCFLHKMLFHVNCFLSYLSL